MAQIAREFAIGLLGVLALIGITAGVFAILMGTIFLPFAAYSTGNWMLWIAWIPFLLIMVYCNLRGGPPI